MGETLWKLFLAFVGGIAARVGAAVAERCILPRLGLA